MNSQQTTKRFTGTNAWVRKRLGVAICATALALAGSAWAAHPAIPDPIPTPIAQGNITVSLTKVADGFVAPVSTAVAPGDKRHLYVVDQIGKLWAVTLPRGNAPVPAPTLALDVTARMVALGIFRGYDERGFLGAVFHPDFRHNGLLYTFTSEPVGPAADFSTQPDGVPANCQTVITEWRVFGNPADDEQSANDNAKAHAPYTVDPNSARVLLRVDKPQFNHDGGTLLFGRDGYLYVSLGDGGAADDEGPGHLPGGNGQSLDTVLGKILRIDPRGHNAANGQYGIPNDNPFVGKPGLDEIWAYGLRNPYRISADRKTGALYVADVGQNDIEEIDIGRAGANFGWPQKEGTFLFDGNGVGATPEFNGAAYQDSPGVPAGLVDPIAQYDHRDNGASARIAIIGGFVSRGERNHALQGRYIFGDYNTAFFSPTGGHVYYLDGKRQINELKFADRASFGKPVLGFGQDSQGEVYVLSNDSGVLSGSTGTVYRIDEANSNGQSGH